MVNRHISYTGVLMLAINEATNCNSRVTDEGLETKIPCVCHDLFQVMLNRLVSAKPIVRDADIACDTHTIIWYRGDDIEIGYCDKYNGIVIRPEFNHTMTIYTNGTLVIYEVGFGDTNIYECYVFQGSSRNIRN